MQTENEWKQKWRERITNFQKPTDTRVKSIKEGDKVVSSNEKMNSHTIVMTDSEWEILKQNSILKGVSVSKLIRDLIKKDQ